MACYFNVQVISVLYYKKFRGLNKHWDHVSKNLHFGRFLDFGEPNFNTKLQLYLPKRLLDTRASRCSFFSKYFMQGSGSKVILKIP